MRQIRLLTFLAAAGFALLAPCLQAQVSSVAPRIAGPVDESTLTTLKGNISAAARADFDKGEASPSAQMHGRLVLSRSSDQNAALDKLMAQQLDKSSPNYQHWLTPGEFNQRFGVADSDLAGIYAWLESHGLTVDYNLSDHSSVAFSGSVSQIEGALHTSIHSFEGNGQAYLAN